MIPEHDYLIRTSFVFGGRQFRVIVEHDGFSYWLDSYAYKDALERDPVLLMMASGRPESDEYKRLAQIYDEWTVKAPIPDDALQKIRDEYSPRYWADDHVEDAVLDAILEPIFWQHVNPELSLPVQKEA